MCFYSCHLWPCLRWACCTFLSFGECDRVIHITDQYFQALRKKVVSFKKVVTVYAVTVGLKWLMMCLSAIVQNRTSTLCYCSSCFNISELVESKFNSFDCKKEVDQCKFYVGLNGNASYLLRSSWHHTNWEKQVFVCA